MASEPRVHYCSVGQFDDGRSACGLFLSRSPVTSAALASTIIPERVTCLRCIKFLREQGIVIVPRKFS